MEVSNDVVGVLQLDIDRHQRQHQAAETADGEQADERQRKSIGVSKVIEPRHSVATQLKTFTPVGMAMSIVVYMKNNCPPTGMPVVNMWCAQTMNERKAIEATA
jgi:hypothetical protein